VTTPDITAAMQAAMDGENRRRRLASQAPGSGALLGLPQPPSGAGIGISDADMPVMGEGYGGPSIAPVPGGTGAPSYADDLVGGIGFQGGRSEPAVRHVSDIGDGRLLIEPYTDGSNTAAVVVSPQAPWRSLWARLAGRLRRR
jgi:hypothetical protein